MQEYFCFEVVLAEESVYTFSIPEPLVADFFGVDEALKVVFLEGFKTKVCVFFSLFGGEPAFHLDLHKWQFGK